MMTPDVNIQLMNFPNPGKEMVVKNEDDTYTILINARLTRESQIKAYEHAMRHIMNNDFSRDDTQEIEAVAHEIIKPAQTQPEPAIPQSTNTVKTQKRKKRRQRKPQDRYPVYDRAEFLAEHFDLFALAEHQYLYGRDL